MDEIILSAILLGSLALFGSNKTSLKGVGSIPYGSIQKGIFKPYPQKSFKSELSYILENLENDLEITNLKDYFLTIGWIESRYYPSAIAHLPGLGYYPDLFPKNQWRGNKSLWEYTGGLFQIFPYNALSASDNKAKNLPPTMVFDPYYTIAFSIDFAYRLHYKYNADTWFDIRLGWAGLNVLKQKPPQKILDIEGRLLKSTNENNINEEFLWEPVDFGKYTQYGFKGTLELIQSYKKQV